MENLMEILEIFGLRGAAEEILTVAGTVIAIVGAVVAIWNLILYVLKASGLYAAAKRREVGKAWLAWVPVVNYWVAGALADQYMEQMRCKRRYQRVILLILGVVSFVLTWVLNGLQISILVDGIRRALSGDINSLGVAIALAAESGGLLVPVRTVLNLVLLVFWQIALHNIYRAANPKHAVTFTVLGIIFPVTVPFFLFFNRKRDTGMETLGADPVPAGYLPDILPDDIPDDM